MTAFELRRHLAADHGIDLRGANYAQLVAVHNDDHQTGAEHIHTDEAGHLGGGLEQILYLIVLFVFIIVFLRLLGVVIVR